jgi:hypothetical protein
MKPKTAKRDVNSPAFGEANHEEIARRAYEIYLKRGAVPGHELDDWVQAEEECRSQAASTASLRTGVEMVIQPSGGFGPDVCLTKS